MCDSCLERLSPGRDGMGDGGFRWAFDSSASLAPSQFPEEAGPVATALRHLLGGAHPAIRGPNGEIDPPSGVADSSAALLRRDHGKHGRAQTDSLQPRASAVREVDLLRSLSTHGPSLADPEKEPLRLQLTSTGGRVSYRTDAAREGRRFLLFHSSSTLPHSPSSRPPTTYRTLRRRCSPAVGSRPGQPGPALQHQPVHDRILSRSSGSRLDGELQPRAGFP